MMFEEYGLQEYATLLFRSFCHLPDVKVAFVS